jgi:hypothetical protein
MKRALLLVTGLFFGVAPALADPPCGVVEVRMQPAAANLQIVVWIEDTSGRVIATPYITRATGQFGLANRPGNGLLKTAFGWPYGRREMVAPVWAHRRNHHYPKVMMGGRQGNSPSSSCVGQTCNPSACNPTQNGDVGCQGGCCCGDCNDDTIAYHSTVSSGEPFYCPPDSMPDAVSCASTFTGSKGAYATDGSYSLYPPRADLTGINTSVDSTDVLDFAKKNDLVAVSAATPPPNALLNPPLYWYPGVLAVGDYVAWIEISQESDFNNSNNHPNVADAQSAWNFEGHGFLGQPSIVWKVPFHYDGTGQSAITSSYAGYSTWDGSDGVLHSPDGTITTGTPGSGAGRLAMVTEGIDVYQAKVVVGNCGGTLPTDGGVFAPDGGANANCKPPDPVQGIMLSPDQTSITVSFVAASSGPAANRFAVRYRRGTQPIADADFDTALAAPSAAGNPGDTVSATITPLDRATDYTVAVRAVAPCGTAGEVVSASTQTLQPKFATLHGCFLATAAYGSPLEQHVASLRAFRDRHLLTNPAGRLVTAIYYALSPALASAIASDEGLRALARRAIAPLFPR